MDQVSALTLMRQAVGQAQPFQHGQFFSGRDVEAAGNVGKGELQLPPRIRARIGVQTTPLHVIGETDNAIEPVLDKAEW